MTKTEISELQIRRREARLPYVPDTPEIEYSLFDKNEKIVATRCKPEFLLKVRELFYGTSPNRSLAEKSNTFEPFDQRRQLVSLSRPKDQTMLIGWMWPREIERIKAFNATVPSPIEISMANPAMDTNCILTIETVQSTLFRRYKRRIEA